MRRSYGHKLFSEHSKMFSPCSHILYYHWCWSLLHSSLSMCKSKHKLAIKPETWELFDTKKVSKNWFIPVTFESKLMDDSLFTLTTSSRNLSHWLLESSHCREEICCLSCKWSTNFSHLSVETSVLVAMLHVEREAANVITINSGGFFHETSDRLPLTCFYTLLEFWHWIWSNTSLSTFLNPSFAAEPNFSYKKFESKIR